MHYMGLNLKYMGRESLLRILPCTQLHTQLISPQYRRPRSHRVLIFGPGVKVLQVMPIPRLGILSGDLGVLGVQGQRAPDAIEDGVNIEMCKQIAHWRQTGSDQGQTGFEEGPVVRYC